MPDDYADHVRRWTSDTTWSPGRLMVLPEEETVISPPHVWVVYGREDTDVFYATSIHLTAEDAARKAAGSGLSVGKWPLGMDLDEAIKAWEGRS